MCQLNVLSYSFKELQERFEGMSFDEILEEYTNVNEQYTMAMQSPDEDAVNAPVFDEYAMARDYLANYIAQLVCDYYEAS